MRARDALKKSLDRFGLLRVAYWLNEQLRVIRFRAEPVPPEFSHLSDGLALPPPRLIVSIGGSSSALAYLHGGKAIADAMRELLAMHDIDIASFKAILEFGCGSGRIIRRLKDLSPVTQLHGTDYNSALVKWCRDNLRFAQFGANHLRPPLRYADASFDFVYAFSVFTHLSEELQLAWFDELRRILAPGGYLIFTVHSNSATGQLTPEEQQSFAQGNLIVRYESAAGSNLCAVFHPERYIRRVLARGWRVVNIRSSQVGQTFVLLQKPPSDANAVIEELAR